MATNQKEKKHENANIEVVNENTTEVIAPIADIPVDEPNPDHIVESEEDIEGKSEYTDIDAVCEMLNVARKERDDEEEQQRRDKEKERKRQEDNAMAAQKAESEKARQAEETRKINEGRYIRKKMKRKATRMLFCLCIMSAVFGYVVAGILVHIIFDPKVWIFVGVMGIFGMVNTLIHTYLYRYIREEIYRK